MFDAFIVLYGTVLFIMVKSNNKNSLFAKQERKNKKKWMGDDGMHYIFNCMLREGGGVLSNFMTAQNAANISNKGNSIKKQAIYNTVRTRVISGIKQLIPYTIPGRLTDSSLLVCSSSHKQTHKHTHTYSLLIVGLDIMCLLVEKGCIPPFWIKYYIRKPSVCVKMLLYIIYIMILLQ